MTSEAFFLRIGDGQRFCIHHSAVTNAGAPALGRVIYIHPFAEEMNKSRRMAAMQARALAKAGFDVLQIDLLGCGDSSGDFGDASWSAWTDDVVAAYTWLNERTVDEGGHMPRPPTWLWGLRTGCLLAVLAADAIPEPCHFLFWAPTPSGKLVLQQFLRLKATGELGSGGAKAIMESLRAELADGRPVEIAGYLLPPLLAAGLEKASLTPPASGRLPRRVAWFELTTRPDSGFTPASDKAVAPWLENGCSVNRQLVVGPSFWQTTEIEDAPELLAATILGVARA